jgi:hypothetical protein
MKGGVADYENTHGVEGEGGVETGTQSAEPCVKNIASVTICQVRNKACELNGLRASLPEDEKKRGERNRSQRPHS